MLADYPRVKKYLTPIYKQLILVDFRKNRNCNKMKGNM